MLLLLCYSSLILTDVVEHYISQVPRRLLPRSDRPSLVIKWMLNWIVAFFRPHTDFKGVFYRFMSLCILATSFSIVVIGPFLHYLCWLKSVHSIDNFVESFNPNTGKPYKGQSIESDVWPTFIDHIMTKPTDQFLLFLLIIQSMKPVAFHLVPPYVPKYIRLNIVLFSFAWGFNIDAIEHLFVLLFLLLVVFVPAFHIQNQYYAKNLLCATTILLITLRILYERHEIDKFYYKMNKCHYEIMCCSILLLPLIIRRFRLIG